MKKNKVILIIMLMLFPTTAFASSSIIDNSLSIITAIFIEAFVTIHMSLFVLKPLSKMLSKENNNKLFWRLFKIRIAILLFFDIFITTNIAIIDFIAVFIGAFIVVPITAIITKKTIFSRKDNNMNSLNNNLVNNNSNVNQGLTLKCAKCGNELKIDHKFCTKCGAAFDGNNVTVSLSDNAISTNQQKTIPTAKVPVLPSSFDSIYKLSEDKMVEEFINRELIKAGINKNNTLIPSDILKRKKILNTIFSILLFVFISLIFFHFPIATYAIGIIILIIFYKITRRFNLLKYLKKELKARPNEKITNIVMSVKNTFVPDTSKKPFILTICLAVILPLIIFIEPKILYEKVDNGYAVRYYTFGVTNFTTATIPENYKGEKVISLRGNTFSNMPFLKTINLPDSITEIRGQAFRNNRSLKTIKLPTKLEYLGGGAFYNCSSLTSIEIPDTVTYLGGEAFYNATSLESVKLSSNISEIRGNTFENCSSLKSITIPDKVTRIGGHAFYGCSSLGEVIFTENSLLKEIGSSAFRQCDSLYSITIPSNVDVNYRAFKESPTKVKEFGEIDYGSLIESNNYAYNTSIFIYIGEKKEINTYRSYAKLQNAYIYLESITINTDSNEFTLKYNDDSGEKTYILSAQKPYVVINDNLALEISSDYVLKYDKSVSLKVYYN